MREQRSWTEAESARLQEMWAEGMEAKEIAAALGRSPDSIIGHKQDLKKRGIKLERRNTQGRFLRAEGHCHPVVRFMRKEMRAQRATYADLSRRTGIPVDTIRTWSFRSNPQLCNIEAALGALGFQIVVKPL